MPLNWMGIWANPPDMIKTEGVTERMAQTL